MKKVISVIVLSLLNFFVLHAQEALKIGDIAPAFTAKNQDGKNVSLSDYKGKKVIVYFYPKDNTPGCTTEACNLRDNNAELLKSGYVILGISIDDSASHQAFKKEHKLPFDLLVDSDRSINQKYGVWKEKDGKKIYGTVRTTFVIDEKGKIIKIIDNVHVADHASQILN